MRREGYELQVSRPEVIEKEIDGVKCEPFERVQIDTPEEYMGSVIESLSLRKGEMQDMVHTGNGQFWCTDYFNVFIDIFYQHFFYDQLVPTVPFATYFQHIFI
ncbi:hypothetical protein EfmAA610_13060 [Enterococcus faecium]|nr:hypothetical protein EfmAA610_13060 [Enterococcus faecium]